MSDLSHPAGGFLADLPASSLAASGGRVLRRALRATAIGVSLGLLVSVLASALLEVHQFGEAHRFQLLGAFVASNLSAILLFWSHQGGPDGSAHGRDRVRVGVRATCWAVVVVLFGLLALAA